MKSLLLAHATLLGFMSFYAHASSTDTIPFAAPIRKAYKIPSGAYVLELTGSPTNFILSTPSKEDEMLIRKTLQSKEDLRLELEAGGSSLMGLRKVVRLRGK